MNRLYVKLKDDERFNGKLKLHEFSYELNQSGDCMSIAFHEYLWLEYIESNYTSILDEGLINLWDSCKRCVAHWHITDDDEAFEVVSCFADGNEIYIEDTKKFSLSRLRVMPKESFEKKKERYMTKKHLRIYSGNHIIKQND